VACIGYLFSGLALNKFCQVDQSHWGHQLSCEQGFLYYRVSARQPRSFSFGKRTQHKGFAFRDEPTDRYALRDVLCKVTPSLPSFNWTGANLRRAGQLAESILSHAEGLKQGPPVEESVPPLGQTAGVGAWETNISVTQMKEKGTIYSI